MSTEEQKPAVTTEAGAVEPTPAPAEVLTSDKPADAVEPKAEETVKPEGEAAATAEETKEEKKEEKAEEKPIEPIYSGALGYKAPGLKNAFRFSKKYFWFGEEPVPVQSLNDYLRGEKAEIANPTAAWSSQTGKGLLYFVKHADAKATPAGVLNLSEATDLSKDGITNFHFKLHGHKHAFETSTLAERNGWFVALEKAIEEAKAAKEGIVGSESYKEELNKLRKPTALTPAASTPKKSTDVTPKPAETEPTAESSTAGPARAGSSSSSSSDEEKKKKKKAAAKSKSRSVSRGKRASLFGGFLNKKDKLEEKKEEKKEEQAEKKEEKKEEEATPATATEAPAATAPVIPAPEAVPALEAPQAEEAAAPVAEDKKVEEEKPKPTKRGSIFGNFVEKLKSPTHEKKEADLVPAPVAKEPETTAETAKPEETPAAPAAPATDGTTEATPATDEPKAETKAATTTPHKEKQGFSFGKFLGGAKEKVKSPTAEKSAETKAPETKAEDTVKPEETPAPAVTPAEPVAEEPKEVKKEEEPATGVTSTASATPATKAKRGSIFGNLTGSVKKEKEGETSEKPAGLMGLFRNASKAGRSKKEKETTATPTKVDEATEPKEEKKETPAVEDKKEETPAVPAATEPTTIGDVVPDAVTVGQAPEIKSTPQVASTA